MSGAGTRKPLIVSGAINGASKTKADHPALPMSSREIGAAAAACGEAGAVMIHFHARSEDGCHSLDADLIREATSAIRRESGVEMIVQVSSEAAGIYGPAAQHAMVRAVRPEAVTVAVREMCPSAAEEPEFAEFSAWMSDAGVFPQYVLYDTPDLRRFAELRRRGVIAGEIANVIYVLGRYSKAMRSRASELLPFLAVQAEEGLQALWSVCAFGSKEAACCMAAAALGGHCRVGFENNLHLANGQTAPDNAALVGQVADHTALVGRCIADASAARNLLGMR